MKKVCHITSRHPEEDVRIFHKECVSLAKAGYDVYLVERGDTYDKNGVHIVGVGELREKTKWEKSFKNPRLVYRKALEIDADIYHIHDRELLRCGLALKRRGKTVIYDSHENYLGYILSSVQCRRPVDFLKYPYRKVRYLLYSWYQPFICKKLDCVITVTPDLNRYFMKFQPHTAMITNYPLLEEQCESRERDSRLLCFAGGIKPEWNHDSVIRALERLPDMRYILMGASSDFIQSLRKLPAWKQVDFRGKVPHEEVLKILSQCGIGLATATPSENTYFWEGTLGNNKLFEEMMAGLPVICTKFRLWREIIDKYQCGICVTPGNVEELVAAIRYLTDHPEEARKMGENGRRAVEEEYNWATQEKKLLEVYARL